MDSHNLSKGLLNGFQMISAAQDLAQPFFRGRFDFVLSLEVAEHIPEAQLPMFLENIERHADKGAVISWSWCGAKGERHVSCRSQLEARELMASVGRGPKNLNHYIILYYTILHYIYDLY